MLARSRPASRTARLLLAVVAPVVLLAAGACSSDEPEVFAVPEPVAGEVVEIDSAEGASLIESEDDVLVIDVRTTEEYMDGHLVGAQNISIEDDETWERRVAALDPEQTTVVYCRTGRRSAEAAQRLVEAGFTSVYDLGGVENWDPDELQVEA